MYETCKVITMNDILFCQKCQTYRLINLHHGGIRVHHLIMDKLLAEVFKGHTGFSSGML